MMKAFRKILITTVLGIMMAGLFVMTAYAADDAKSEDEKKKNEIDYTLNKDVKAWLDAGNSIPSEAKYATLASSDHLWELDDTDVSDGKVELKANEETCILAGIALRDWLKTQSFYGEKLGEPDNKLEFVRPKKSKAF